MKKVLLFFLPFLFLGVFMVDANTFTKENEFVTEVSVDQDIDISVDMNYDLPDLSEGYIITDHMLMLYLSPIEVKCIFKENLRTKDVNGLYGQTMIVDNQRGISNVITYTPTKINVISVAISINYKARKEGWLSDSWLSSGSDRLK